jgi:outer membrane protein assembly factor BamD (BamD/ComL family)
VGVALLTENGGPLKSSTLSSTDGFVSAEGLTNRNLLGVVGYSFALSPRLALGLSLTGAWQSNFGDALMGVGMDAGVNYTALDHPTLGTHRIGAAAHNLLQPAMESSMQLSSGATQNSYPRSVRLLWHGDYLQKRLLSSLQWSLHELGGDAAFFTKLGESTSEWELDGRIGYKPLKLLQAHLLFGLGDEKFEYWGVACGAAVAALNESRELTATYQYVQKTVGLRASAHSVYVTAQVGKERKEPAAKPRENFIPNRLYTSAMRLYYQQKYLEAFLLFSQILREYPQFFKNDFVSYYQGRCQEEMDMYPQAASNLRALKRHYGRSSIIPQADLALMRIYYAQKDYEQVNDQFELLSTIETPDSLRFHAHYLMGQTLLAQDRALGAYRALTAIPPEHPDYLFARHSAAIAAFRMDREVDAYENLKICLGAEPRTKLEQTIVERSALVAGYAFLQDEKLGQATAAFSQIPPQSLFWEEALRGHAWAALKSGRGQACRDIVNELRLREGYGVLQAEAELLLAYTEINAKKFKQAKLILEQASYRLDTASTAVDPSASYANLSDEELVSGYAGFSHILDSLGGSKELGSVDSLVELQQKYAAALKQRYQQEFRGSRNALFGRDRGAIRSDIDYALAVVSRRIEMEEQLNMQHKQQRQMNELDRELQDLQQQLEKTDEE